MNIVHRIQNKIYTIYDNLLKFRFDHACKKSIVRGIVLMYHHITDDYVNINQSCKHTIQEFKIGIQMMIDLGYEFVSPDEAIRRIIEKDSRKFALITFDDVPRNAYENAVPYLVENKIPFIFFISTDFIDQPTYLTTEDIKRLVQIPECSIGAHTKTHPMLRKSYNKRTEIEGSKKILEKIIGHNIDYFAYPYGKKSSVSKKVIRIVREAGFKSAFGTISANISDKCVSSLFYLPRKVVRLSEFQ